ncbi:MAG TPA: hypothetical protein VGJ00_07790 [Rhabdochlamydiaceae bacterium]|jgi:hypothetical protein
MSSGSLYSQNPLAHTAQSTHSFFQFNQPQYSQYSFPQGSAPIELVGPQTQELSAQDKFADFLIADQNKHYETYTTKEQLSSASPVELQVLEAIAIIEENMAFCDGQALRPDQTRLVQLRKDLLASRSPLSAQEKAFVSSLFAFNNSLMNPSPSASLGAPSYTTFHHPKPTAPFAPQTYDYDDSAIPPPPPPFDDVPSLENVTVKAQKPKTTTTTKPNPNAQALSLLNLYDDDESTPAPRHVFSPDTPPTLSSFSSPPLPTTPSTFRAPTQTKIAKIVTKLEKTKPQGPSTTTPTLKAPTKSMAQRIAELDKPEPSKVPTKTKKPTVKAPTKLMAQRIAELDKPVPSEVPTKTKKPHATDDLRRVSFTQPPISSIQIIDSSDEDSEDDLPPVLPFQHQAPQSSALAVFNNSGYSEYTGQPSYVPSTVSQPLFNQYASFPTSSQETSNQFYMDRESGQVFQYIPTEFSQSSPTTSTFPYTPRTLSTPFSPQPLGVTGLPSTKPEWEYAIEGSSLSQDVEETEDAQDSSGDESEFLTQRLAKRAKRKVTFTAFNGRDHTDIRLEPLNLINKRPDGRLPDSLEQPVKASWYKRAPNEVDLDQLTKVKQMLEEDEIPVSTTTSTTTTSTPASSHSRSFRFSSLFGSGSQPTTTVVPPTTSLRTRPVSMTAFKPQAPTPSSVTPLTTSTTTTPTVQRSQTEHRLLPPTKQQEEEPSILDSAKDFWHNFWDKRKAPVTTGSSPLTNVTASSALLASQGTVSASTTTSTSTTTTQPAKPPVVDLLNVDFLSGEDQSGAYVPPSLPLINEPDMFAGMQIQPPLAAHPTPTAIVPPTTTTTTTTHTFRVPFDVGTTFPAQPRRKKEHQKG